MKAKLEAVLDRIGQRHVLAFWETLREEERESLARQVARLDGKELDRMCRLLRDRKNRAGPVGAPEIVPAPVQIPNSAEIAAARREGETALREGQVGVLLAAGGQGSRLGFDGPKGCFPVGPVSHASLFEIHARKVLALGRRYAPPPPLYIMTSAANDARTRAFFEEHESFGLDPRQVFFFAQGMCPALDADGKLLLETPGRIFMSPDGHGGAIAALDRSGALADMRRRGLRQVFYFQVDNPLVEVADPAFVGRHRLDGVRMSNKVCAKRDPEEGLGVVAERPDGAPCIVEYTELSPAQKYARNADGALRFRYGSVAIHVFDVEFLAEAAQRAMPLHLAHKKVPFVDSAGRRIIPEHPNAFKFEKFIFDVLPWAGKTVNLVFEREEEFAPVKNAAGEDSPETCRRALLAKWARWLDACGIALPRDRHGVPDRRLEIDPCFARNAEELKQRLPLDIPATGPILWRGRA